MLSFHGKQEIKDEYIARVRAHALADEIIQGTYWSGGKGCAVGCTIHGNDHYAYERELGIPTAIAKLEDRIFEGLPNEIAKGFPLRFLEAVPVGVDLSMVVPKMMLWLFIDEKHGVINHASEKGKKSIQAIADLYIKKIAGETVTVQQWIDARKNADAYAAASAASAAASSAADAAAASSAAADAYAAASASSAADAAAAADARRSHFISQADQLIVLLSACV